jgi:hypothetical protein
MRINELRPAFASRGSPAYRAIAASIKPRLKFLKPFRGSRSLARPKKFVNSNSPSSASSLNARSARFIAREAINFASSFISYRNGLLDGGVDACGQRRA